jgi:Ca2+-transporting ATPase
LVICTKVLDNGVVRALTEEEKEHILEINTTFAKEAMRVLGFAYKQTDSNDKDAMESELIFV